MPHIVLRGGMSLFIVTPLSLKEFLLQLAHCNKLLMGQRPSSSEMFPPQCENFRNTEIITTSSPPSQSTSNCEVEECLENRLEQK